MSSILQYPVPPLPGSDPLSVLVKIYLFFKSLLTSPKKEETPQETLERNRQMKEFCDYVNAQAKQTEDAVVIQLKQYNEYLCQLSEKQFSNYNINTKYFVRQIDLLSSQIPGTIAAEVSRQLTDSNGEFSRIRRMLPGAEKETAMQNLAYHAIQDGCDKCAALAQQIFDQIQEGLFTDLQEKMAEAKGQLERKNEELAALQATAGDVQKQVHFCMEAQLKYKCGTMVNSLINGEGA